MIADAAPGDGGFFVLAVGHRVAALPTYRTFCPLCSSFSDYRFPFTSRSGLAAGLRFVLGLPEADGWATDVHLVEVATYRKYHKGELPDRGSAAQLLSLQAHASPVFSPDVWLCVFPHAPEVTDPAVARRVFYGTRTVTHVGVRSEMMPSVDFAQAAAVDYDLVDLALIADSL